MRQRIRRYSPYRRRLCARSWQSIFENGGRNRLASMDPNQAARSPGLRAGGVYPKKTLWPIWRMRVLSSPTHYWRADWRPRKPFATSQFACKSDPPLCRETIEDSDGN